MSLKIDCHVHTLTRGKVYVNAAQLKQAILATGIDGVAVTNFFDVEYARWLQKKIPEHIIIVGQEVWTAGGHVIGLGLTQRVADYQTIQKTVDDIHDQGGLAVAVHPFLFHGVGNALRTVAFDAVEVYNGLSGALGIFHRQAERLASLLKLPMLASSDTSDARWIGRSYSEVLTEDRANVLPTIKQGMTRLRRQPLPLPWKFVAQNLLGFKHVRPWPLHATPCLACNESWVVSWQKRARLCLSCGVTEMSRIACCQGHYYCHACLSKVGNEQALALRQREYAD